MKLFLTLLGFIFVILGFIGIFLPVLPTTPFLLLSATLFFRSSPKAYTWLMEHKYFGPYIKSFREEKAIPLRVKIISISLMWLTAVHCMVFVFHEWWLNLFMGILSIGVSGYILSLKTRMKK